MDKGNEIYKYLTAFSEELCVDCEYRKLRYDEGPCKTCFVTPSNLKPSIPSPASSEGEGEAKQTNPPFEAGV